MNKMTTAKIVRPTCKALQDSGKGTLTKPDKVSKYEPFANKRFPMTVMTRKSTLHRIPKRA